MVQLSSAQYRAARALLDWSLVEASRRAGMSVAQIIVAEDRRRGEAVIDHAGLRKAFEEAGVLFLQDDGVRIRR